VGQAGRVSTVTKISEPDSTAEASAYLSWLFLTHINLLQVQSVGIGVLPNLHEKQIAFLLEMTATL